MFQKSQWAVLALCLALLDACSSSSRQSAEFTLDGVQAPPSQCPINPQSFGEAAPIPDFHEGNGCGVTNGYHVMSIANVAFNPQATITCDLADALNGWIQSSVQPAAQQIYGSQVVAFRVAASYACRARNSIHGAKLSEHGQGDAIDIAAFTLANGREVVVLTGYYGATQDQRFLRTVRAQACGPFHTVLGPGSDPFHRDHIHLDRQRERRGGGPFCH